MSRRTDDKAALNSLQRAIEESAEWRKRVPPISPGEWLHETMQDQGATCEDVARQTNGLSPRDIERLIRGSEPFLDEVCNDLDGFLGPRVKILKAINQVYAHFLRFGERPGPSQLPDTAETRKTARWFVGRRKAIASAEHS